jgi:plasmid stabilization system protein ParE
MGCKIIFAPKATARLEEIVRYIVEDDPIAAERFGAELLKRADLLSDFPELGTLYRKRRNVRRLWCKPYFIYYRFVPARQLVEIMDYWHSARREPVL